mmetsp:Transcript_41448/g.99836  ORF Transcript_41448/g.99836 Transcript_41448/m.99836 type:complete len:267 (-) Transcript_41448:16-816(-)
MQCARYDSTSIGSSRVTQLTVFLSQRSKLLAFFLHIGLGGSAFFTSYMAIQTLLLVRYAWTEKQMQKAEYAFFGWGLVGPLTTGIWAAAEGLFHPFLLGACWINSAVEDCPVEHEQRGPLLDEYCNDAIPADRLLIYQMVFAYAWIMLGLLMILFSMVSLYLFVRKRERQAARWSQNASDGRQQKRVLTKSIAIIAAYLFTWTPTIVLLTPAVDPRAPGVAIIPGTSNLRVVVVVALVRCTHCLSRSGLNSAFTRILQRSHLFWLC